MNTESQTCRWLAFARRVHEKILQRACRLKSAFRRRAGTPDSSGRFRRILSCVLAVVGIAISLVTAAARGDERGNISENTLTDAERNAGWLLLFDGRTTGGWINSDRTAPRTTVQDVSLNPHKAGHYMLVHTQQWENFVLSLDFKISKGCNSGIFVRTSSLTPQPGKDVGFNGIEIAIDDTSGAGYHDTGAIYDLVKPAKNAMKPVGEWNHTEITSDRGKLQVVLNDEPVTKADLNEFTEPSKRPDGTSHKFDIAYKNHPQRGYIGLQDHGRPCWFKNIKLKPLR